MELLHQPHPKYGVVHPGEPCVEVVALPAMVQQKWRCNNPPAHVEKRPPHGPLERNLPDLPPVKLPLCHAREEPRHPQVDPQPFGELEEGPLELPL